MSRPLTYIEQIGGVWQPMLTKGDIKTANQKLWPKKAGSLLMREFFGQLWFDRRKETMDEVDARWFVSDKTDLSYYTKPEYCAGAFVCAYERSRPWIIKGVRWLKEHGHGKWDKSILDFGAGIGISTLVITLLLPKATVVYANVESTQAEFFKYILWRVGVGVEIVDDKQLSSFPDNYFSTSFTSEVFEHFADPIRAVDLVNRLTSDVLIEHSGFGYLNSEGHFPEYRFVNDIIPNGVRATKRFLSELALRGWRRQPTKFFNGSPRIFFLERIGS